MLEKIDVPTFSVRKKSIVKTLCTSTLTNCFYREKRSNVKRNERNSLISLKNEKKRGQNGFPGAPVTATKTSQQRAENSCAPLRTPACGLPPVKGWQIKRRKGKKKHKNGKREKGGEKEREEAHFISNSDGH